MNSSNYKTQIRLLEIEIKVTNEKKQKLMADWHVRNDNNESLNGEFSKVWAEIIELSDRVNELESKTLDIRFL